MIEQNRYIMSHVFVVFHISPLKKYAEEENELNYFSLRWESRLQTYLYIVTWGGFDMLHGWNMLQLWERWLGGLVITPPQTQRRVGDCELATETTKLGNR